MMTLTHDDIMEGALELIGRAVDTEYADSDHVDEMLQMVGSVDGILDYCDWLLNKMNEDKIE